MGFVSCQAGANPGGGGGAPICRTKKAMYLNACVWEGMWAWDQIPPRFRVSGPRLFSIQGLCVLVSINTEINTALQSAPFINGVTHLMRSLCWLILSSLWEQRPIRESQSAASLGPLCICNWQGQLPLEFLDPPEEWGKCVKVAQSCPTLRHPMDSPQNSPGQNTGVGSLLLLQGIFPTQGSKPGLLHCRWILYQLSHKGYPHKSPAHPQTDTSFKSYFNGLLWTLFFMSLFYFSLVSGSQSWMDSS